MPKIRSPRELADLRPVALTSLVMKIFERLVKEFPVQKVQGQLALMQFAYWACRGVDDATITLFNYLYKCLGGYKNTRRAFIFRFFLSL